MIDTENNYTCGSSDAPNEATYICYQKGCTSYPFTCGLKNCTCRGAHGGHQSQSFDWLKGKINSAAPIPERLPEDDKVVEGLIKELIAKLETVKQRHHEFVNSYGSGCRTS